VDGSVGTSRAELATSVFSALGAAPIWRERSRAMRTRTGVARFLRHVATSVPHYRALFRQGPRPDGLAVFPTISRTDRMASPRAFRSGAYRRADIRWTQTSGSSGSPLRIALDPAGWYHQTHGCYAQIVRSIKGLEAHLEPGRVGVVLVSMKAHRRSRAVVVLPLRAALVQLVVIGRSRSEDASVLRLLSRQHIPILHGKPSSLRDLANLAERTGHAGQVLPHAVLVAGETLYDDDRSTLEAAFSAPLFNAYTSAEGGLMALECGAHSGLHMSAHCVLEILKPDGRIESEGTGELLLTNLMNWAAPIVRYRTGDYATIARVPCSCSFTGASLVALPGREATSFEVNGRRIAAASIEHAMTAAGVRDFRVTQTSTGAIELRFVAADLDPGGRRLLKEQVNTELSAMLQGTSCRTIIVRRIERLGTKRRRFVTLQRDARSVS
jgi:phenylacetate-CoA ligase